METNKSPVVSALSSQVPNAGQGREDSSSVQLWELAGCCSEAPRRSHSWLLQAGPEHSQSTPTLRSGYRAGDSVNQHTAKLSRLFLIRVSNRDIVSRSSITVRFSWVSLDISPSHGPKFFVINEWTWGALCFSDDVNSLYSRSIGTSSLYCKE